MHSKYLHVKHIQELKMAESKHHVEEVIREESENNRTNLHQKHRNSLLKWQKNLLHVVFLTQVLLAMVA